MVSCCSVDFLRFLLFWRFISLSSGSFRKCQSTKTRPFSLTDEVNMHIYSLCFGFSLGCSRLFMVRKYGLKRSLLKTERIIKGSRAPPFRRCRSVTDRDLTKFSFYSLHTVHIETLSLAMTFKKMHIVFPCLYRPYSLKSCLNRPYQFVYTGLPQKVPFTRFLCKLLSSLTDSKYFFFPMTLPHVCSLERITANPESVVNRVLLDNLLWVK